MRESVCLLVFDFYYIIICLFVIENTNINRHDASATMYDTLFGSKRKYPFYCQQDIIYIRKIIINFTHTDSYYWAVRTRIRFSLYFTFIITDSFDLIRSQCYEVNVNCSLKFPKRVTFSCIFVHVNYAVFVVFDKKKYTTLLLNLKTKSTFVFDNWNIFLLFL